MRKEREKKRRGFGTFILGWFVGFICTLLILAGVGYWAYTSISVGRIEKWTKSDIAGNNEGIRKLTLQDVVGIAMGVAKGSDDYTLAKFEEDFGIQLIGDSLYGISLDTLKNAPIKDLKQALNDTIDTATFANILSFMEVEGDLGLLNTLLDSEVKYYVHNGKLYTSNGYSTEVDFKYTIEGSTVKFANATYTVRTEDSYSVITPMLRHLPLQTAMSSLEGATQGLKIYEVLGYTREGVEGSYTYKDGNVEVTGIMASLAGYSVGDLSNSETFNNLYVYEVMGYYYDEPNEKYYKTYIDGEYSEEVTGVLKYLVPSTIGGLNDTITGLTLGKALDVDKASATGVVKTFYETPINQLASKIQNIKVYEAMGYYYDEPNDKFYNNYNPDTETYSNEVVLTGIMKAIAGTEVSELSSTIENLKAKDVFDKETTTILNLFTEDELNGSNGQEALTVMDMPNAVVNKLNSEDTTIGDLLDAGVIEVDGTVSEYVRGMTIEELILELSKIPTE